MSGLPRTVVQIPIKHRSSERVPNKNFHPFHGKPLAYWVLDEVVRHVPAEWDVFIDSESEEVFAKLTDTHRKRFGFHRRPEWYASNEANGNHLLQQFVSAHPEYDVYAQVYVTAVMMRGATIIEAIDALHRSDHDSVMTVTEESGWIWFRDRALNYDPQRPDGLPRSQDARYLKETTGLYAVRRPVALHTGCRVGSNPLFMPVSKTEALDIDTLEDLKIADLLFERS